MNAEEDVKDLICWTIRESHWDVFGENETYDMGYWGIPCSFYAENMFTISNSVSNNSVTMSLTGRDPYRSGSANWVFK